MKKYMTALLLCVLLASCASQHPNHASENKLLCKNRGSGKVPSIECN